MSDERDVLTAAPDMLAPEQGSPVEVQAEVEPQEVAGGRVAEDTTQFLPSTETPSVPLPESSRQEVSAAPEKDPTTREVEQILEDKMGDHYDTLDDAQKIAFAHRGEALCQEIVTATAAKRPDYVKILHAVEAWMHMAPLLTDEWVDQEAAIKVKRIVEVAEREKQKGSLAA